MASMTFVIDDKWTYGTDVENGVPQPRVQVSITENGDGTLSFNVAIMPTSEWTGDLRAFYFDVLGDRALAIRGETTNVATAAIETETDGTVTDMGMNGNDASTNPLFGEGGNWDAGLLLGDTGYDGITSLSFNVSASGGLSLADFAGQTFGIRVKSTDDVSTTGVEGGSSKIIEYTSPAIDARDDEACVVENASTSGNVLDNDANATGNINSVSGSAVGTTLLANAEGVTFTLNADGSYVLDASTADALSEREHFTYTFDYDAKSIVGNDPTSWSTDSGTITICVDGKNDGPIARDDDAGCIDEGDPLAGKVTDNDSDVDRLDTHTWALVDNSFDGLGNLTFNSDGTWSYDAAGAYDDLNEGDTVNLSFQYAMTDNYGGSDTATVSFCIDGVGGGSDHFPNHPKDISNIVLYFNDDAAITGDTRGAWLTETLKGGKTKVTATADGVYTVKIDTPSAFNDDLDVTLQTILSYVESHGLDPDTELVGVAIKGGNVAHGGYNNFYALDGDTEPEYVMGGNSSMLVTLVGRATLALDNEIDATIGYSSVFPG